MMQNIICPECGVENDAGAKRCKACDFSLLGLEEGSPPASETSSTNDLEFSTNEEQDLPDLLHALKQDGDISSDGKVLENDGEVDDADLTSSDTSQPDEDIPAWLRRIRERAQKESDAAGEITQKISAAQESIAEGKGESQHEDFASWIQSLRRDAGEKELDAPPTDQDKDKEADDNQDDSSQWLSKIRKVKGPTPGDGTPSAADPEEKKGDSLLQWLVALEEGKETIQPPPGEPEASAETPSEESQEEDLDEPGSVGEETQKISPVISQKQEPPELDVSRAEQLRASLFSSTVVDEQSQRPLREPKRKESSWAVRLVLTLLLIAAISGALFGSWPGGRIVGTQPEQGAMLTSIEGLPAEASLLIAADYRAGFSEEIHMIARPILTEAIEPEMQLSLISTQPAGVLLSQRLLAEIFNEIDLEINDLGYFPSSIFGAYAIADFSDGNQPRAGLPESPRANLPADLDGVFILADSYEGARFLVEQLNARMPNVPLYLLVTAQAGPMLAPYQDSGQVVGMVAGISDVEKLDITINGEQPEVNLQGAYQTGTLLLAVMLAIGAMLAAKPKREEKDGESHGLE